jgi:hypothetical protein
MYSNKMGVTSEITRRDLCCFSGEGRRFDVYGIERLSPEPGEVAIDGADVLDLEFGHFLGRNWGQGGKEFSNFQEHL